MIAFLLVNAAALWITIEFIDTLEISDVSIAIGGGFIGWIVVSAMLGVGNWLVKAILK